MNKILSDLFYSHEHPHYDFLLWGGDYLVTDKEPSEVQEAVKKDACAFYERFEIICNLCECFSPEELEEDFLKRIYKKDI